MWYFIPYFFSLFNCALIRMSTETLGPKCDQSKYYVWNVIEFPISDTVRHLNKTIQHATLILLFLLYYPSSLHSRFFIDIAHDFFRNVSSCTRPHEFYLWFTDEHDARIRLSLLAHARSRAICKGLFCHICSFHSIRYPVLWWINWKYDCTTSVFCMKIFLFYECHF